jgi:HTH-type transcriptional regulator, sugar sensing transcriptional regulator
LNSDKIHRTLKEIGLSDNEAKVYIASLQQGPANASTLATQSGVKRTTIYSTLESLQEMGLIHEESRGLKRVFVAEHPDKLESVLQRRRLLLHTILPELSSVYFQIEQTEGSIKKYLGLDGIKRIYDDLLGELKEGDFYLVISDQQKWISHDPLYFEKFKRERAKIGLSIRLILQDSPSARRNKPIQKHYSETVKILPKQVELATNMVIVPHKVIIVQTVEPLLALVIENKAIVQMNRVLFDIIWQAIG